MVQAIKWIVHKNGDRYECIRFPRTVLSKINKAFREQKDIEVNWEDDNKLMNIKLRFTTAGSHVLRMWRDVKDKGAWDRVTTLLGAYC